MKNNFPTKPIFIFSILIFISIGCINDSKKNKAQNIIEGYLNAIGGKKNISLIKTYKSEGYLFQGEMKLSYQNQISFPNKMKVLTKGVGYTEIATYNAGSAGGKINDSLFSVKNTKALKAYEIDCYIIPLAHLDKNAIKIQFVKSTKIDSVNVEEIHIEFKNGLVWNVFFDSKTHLINSFRTSDGFEIKYLKYKPFNQILFPVEFQFKGLGHDLNLVLSNIEYNINFEKNEFDL